MTGSLGVHHTMNDPNNPIKVTTHITPRKLNFSNAKEDFEICDQIVAAFEEMHIEHCGDLLIDFAFSVPSINPDLE